MFKYVSVVISTQWQSYMTTGENIPKPVTISQKPQLVLTEKMHSNTNVSILCIHSMLLRVAQRKNIFCSTKPGHKEKTS